MKRMIAILLTLALVFSLSSMVFAEELETKAFFAPDPASGNLPLRAGGLGYQPVSDKSLKTYSGLEAALVDAMNNCLTELDIYAFRVTPAQLEDVYMHVMDTHPEFFYVNYYFYYYYNGYGYATKIEIDYIIPMSQLAQAKNTYNTKIAEIMSGVDSNWNTLQKLIYLHDYMVDRYSYDMRFYDASQKDQAIYDAYNLMVQETGVCQAYTMLYYALMQQVGVPVSYALSESMDHVWNVVQLGGNWYHVDVTWDDPVPDDFTSVSHRNFLRSDAGISDTGHYGWKCEYTCPSTYYDSGVWSDYSAGFVAASGVDCGFPTNSAMYAVHQNSDRTATVYMWNRDNEMETMFNIPNSFRSSLEGYYGYLVYNDDTHVYYMDVYNKLNYTLYSVDSSCCITGFDVSGSTLKVKVFRYATSTYSTATATMPVVSTDDVSLLQYPNKLVYSAADSGINLSGLQVSARYSDGRTYTRDASYITRAALSVNYNYLYFWLDGYVFQLDLFMARSPFTDVPSGQFYSEPVLWAVENNITTGTGAHTFSPQETCTRGQVVTFLWRAAGKPAPKSTVNPFKDVKSSDYYYQAVLWAVENGITNGTSSSKFSPNESCTRGQVVTFLHRAFGKPAGSGSCSFKDVSPSNYFYDAVIWAVDRGITNGTSSTRFSPNDTCTRGEIVTFLYRAFH